MQCILCEKPSAAKNYSLALGGKSGTFNGKQYTIVNSVGHIFGMIQNMEKQVIDSGLAEKYSKWDIEYLPWHKDDLKFKRALKSDMKKIYDDIKSVAEKCDEIIIATDNDPTGEGELLAWEILSSMNLPGVKYYRCYHLDESKKEIQKAMNCLKYLGDSVPNALANDPDYKKANFRSKWDFMSMQFTRIFTKLGDGNSVLRQGRLKSYMVWTVGEQIDKAKNYKKIPFYTNKFKDENGNIFTSENEPMFEKKEDVDTSKYHVSPVVVDNKVIKYGSPVSLYDLSLLSSSLAPLGFNSKQVLDTYQKMYEDRNSDGEAIVSYPRTEDKTITPEQFNDFLRIADRVAEVVGVDTSLLTHRRARKTHVSASGSHGANRPTGNVPNSLEELEKKYGKCGVMIYKFLARNALAMLCEDYKYEHQEGHIKDYPDFKGTVNIPLDLGYKKIFNDNKEESKETKQLGTIGEPFIFEGFPPKPNMPTAKWLANQLKKNDVGTGATRTSIYADVTDQKTKYPLLIDSKGKITMTPYGEMSYKLLKDTHIGDVKLTEKLQEQMRQVAKGADGDKFLDEMEQLIIEDIQTVKKNAEENGIKQVAGSNKINDCTCPKCGGNILIGKDYYYCSNRKDDTCDFVLRKEINHAKITEMDVKNIASGKYTRVLKMHSDSKDKDYTAYLKYDKEQGKAILTTKKVIGKCGCGGDIVQKEGNYGTYYKCDSCDLTINGTYLDKKFTYKEVVILFNNGKVKGNFISKQNKAFFANIHIDNNNKLKLIFDKK